MPSVKSAKNKGKRVLKSTMKFTKKHYIIIGVSAVSLLAIILGLSLGLKKSGDKPVDLATTRTSEVIDTITTEAPTTSTTEAPTTSSTTKSPTTTTTKAPTTTNAPSSSSRKGMSVEGKIAVIVVVVLLILLAFATFFLKRADMAGFNPLPNTPPRSIN